MDNIFDTSRLRELAFRWRWHLAGIMLTAALAGIFAGSSSVISPRYKSTAIIYPVNLETFSDESQTEQLLQWLNSQDVKDSVIVKLNLGSHYEIDPGLKYHHSAVQKTFDQHIAISKTQYQSISVSAQDVDPQIAHDIVARILGFTEKKIRTVYFEKIEETRQAGDRLLTVKQSEIDSVNSLLSGSILNNPDRQNEQYARIQTPSRQSGGLAPSSRLRVFKPDFSAKSSLLSRRMSLEDEYSLIKQQMEQDVFSGSKASSFINIVSGPQVADRKCYPNRLLIVLAFIGGAFLMSFLTLLFIERFKD